MENSSLEFHPSAAMNLVAEDYNGLNGQQQRDAEETICKILQHSQEMLDIILDVGCGTGNVTSLLAERLPHTRILAIDIDPDMIGFSKRSLSKNNNHAVEFLVQDISLPWHELHPDLQALEGQVSLVWSNRVLHWIPDEDRPRAGENIARFLKPGGRLYINTTLVFDLNEHLPEDEKERNEKILKVPSSNEQREQWRSYFTNTGLSSLEVNLIEREWVFDRPEDFWKLTKVVTIYKRYISRSIPAHRVDEILSTFHDLFARVVATPFGQPTIQSSENLTLWHYGQFRIVGKK